MALLLEEVISFRSILPHAFLLNAKLMIPFILLFFLNVSFRKINRDLVFGGTGLSHSELSAL